MLDIQNQGQIVADIQGMTYQMQQNFDNLCTQLMIDLGKPSTRMRPELKLFDKWDARYGDLTGYGNNPKEAMDDFDNKWNGAK